MQESNSWSLHRNAHSLWDIASRSGNPNWPLCVVRPSCTRKWFKRQLGNWLLGTIRAQLTGPHLDGPESLQVAGFLCHQSDCAFDTPGNVLSSVDLPKLFLEHNTVIPLLAGFRITRRWRAQRRSLGRSHRKIVTFFRGPMRSRRNRSE